MIVTDIAIIGAGPAGLFTVFQAGMLGMKAVVIDSLNHVGGQCSSLYPEKPIYDIPGHPVISGKGLIDNLYKQAAPFSPVYLLGQTADNLTKLEDGSWLISTDAANQVKAKVIIIACGSGSFTFNRPPLTNIESFEDKSIFYAVQKPSIFAGKKVAIAGGGDSALDWAVEISNVAAQVYLIHRRPKFRAMDATVRKVHEIANNGAIDILTPYQLHSVSGEKGELSQIDIIDFDNNIKSIECDYLLPFFGQKMDITPMLDWGIEFDNKKINVDQSTMQTAVEGIYAIGDIANYRGKLKLILNGFAEGATACHDAYNIVFPGKALHFEYSTTKGIVNETVANQ